jgi:hypothetical protein
MTLRALALRHRERSFQKKFLGLNSEMPKSTPETGHSSLLMIASGHRRSLIKPVVRRPTRAAMSGQIIGGVLAR